MVGGGVVLKVEARAAHLLRAGIAFVHDQRSHLKLGVRALDRSHFLFEHDLRIGLGCECFELRGFGWRLAERQSADEQSRDDPCARVHRRLAVGCDSNDAYAALGLLQSTPYMEGDLPVGDRARLDDSAGFDHLEPAKTLDGLRRLGQSYADGVVGATWR